MDDFGVDLVKVIIKEIEHDKKKSLEFAPSFAPTEKDIIQLINLYWVDKYKSGDTNESGWKRAFYNVVENPTLVASKQIDLDTKDFKIIAADGKSFYPAWIYHHK